MQPHAIWEERIQSVKERLKEPLDWFPYPILLTSGLVLILTAHIVSALNPRAGHRANVMALPSSPSKSSAIWLSISPSDNQLIITTAERRVFRWRLDQPQNRDLDALVQHLKATVAQEIESAALSKKASNSQTLAVLAADQRLTFLHIRPVISALAQAGITRYAFETINSASDMR